MITLIFHTKIKIHKSISLATVSSRLQADFISGRKIRSPGKVSPLWSLIVVASWRVEGVLFRAFRRKKTEQCSNNINFVAK